jgi:hypothetical protein
MKIAYIILTCKQYFDTRVQWQLQSMLKNVDKNNVYYLGHIMDTEKRLFSWGAADDYNSLPNKFVDFFRNTELNYDWLFLIDDDTYVFHDRLIELLNTFNPVHKICIGKELDHIKHTIWGLYMSGGAGTVISYPVYKSLCDYVKPRTNAEVIHHWCADICLGMWIKQLNDVCMVNHPQFHADIYDESKDSSKTAITFHHLKTWKDYEACEALTN